MSRKMGVCCGRASFYVVAALALGCWGAASPMTIDRIEVNQGLGVQLLGNLDFVAGKNTVIRAFLSEKTAVDPQATSAAVKRDGSLVATLGPESSLAPVDVVNFVCPDMGTCQGWAPGSYVFEVKVNGVTRSSQGSAITFKARQKLRVLAVKIYANYGGVKLHIPDDSWKKLGHFLERVYPLASGMDGVYWKPREEELDASDDKYDLEKNDESGEKALWQALMDLRTAECVSNPKKDGCFDAIVGFVPYRFGGYPQGGMQGFTNGNPALVAVATDADAATTVAHEIAHFFDVGDTYTGGSLYCAVNPAPDGTVGQDYNNSADKNYRCTSGREKFPTVDATKIPKEQHPFDLSGRGALGDMADFMGGQGTVSQFWITQEVYSRIYEQSAPASPRESLADPQRLLWFSGYISKSGTVGKEPWRSFWDTAPAPDTTGELVVRGVAADGVTVLSSQKLDVRWTAMMAPPAPPRDVDPAPFDGVVRFPAGVAKFQVVRAGDVLAEYPVNASPPSVSGVTPTAPGGSIPGPYTIEWSATSESGARMTCQVLFNSDVTLPDSPWEVLCGSTDGKTWADDFSEWPGGDHAKIRVIASDGILTGQADSAEFSVPFKKPQVSIDEMEDGTSYRAGELVYLSGEVFDMQDETIPDARLTWSSNVSGNIGTGEEVSVDELPPGPHSITFSAVNSVGLSASASTDLFVYVMGDLNADQTVDGADLNLLRGYLDGSLVGFPTPAGALPADMDGDGFVDAVDLVELALMASPDGP